MIRDARRLTQRLEKAAYKAIATAERARRSVREAQEPVWRRGRPRKVHTPLPEAEIQEDQTIAALEPITPAGRRVSVAEAQATLETAIELLKGLGHSQITAFADELHPAAAAGLIFSRCGKCQHISLEK